MCNVVMQRSPERCFSQGSNNWSTSYEMVWSGGPLSTNLVSAIRNWSTEFHISQAAIKSLAGILNTHMNSNLPADARTIMKTPRNINITEMSNNGSYWHQGLENCLAKALEQLDRPLSISLNINIDGLPVHKSSTKNFWPILCKIHEYPGIPPMAVGIYYGTSKPKSATEFLTPFIDELLGILETGVIVNGHSVSVRIRCFICDSPARSFIKGVINFNGKHGCLKCTTKGKYSHTANTVVFSQTNAAARTDEKFRNKEYPEHQRSDTPLVRLPIDMIEDIIVSDALHLLELGVMRRLLNGWRTGSMTKRAKWSSTEKAEISEFLVKLRFPKEIHRRMRSLEFVSLWKGLEYRNFLNYVGLVLLKDHLPEKHYQHFLVLFCAVRISSTEAYKKLLPVAKDLFVDFIQDYKNLYGIDYLTSNVHNLSHVVDEVCRFGSLPTLSAYPFENYLHSIKKMLHAGPLPLNQIANRLTELINSQTPITLKTAFQANERSVRSVEKTETKVTVTLTDFVVNTNFEDKWMLTQDLSIICFKDIVKDCFSWKMAGNALLNKFDFFVKPFKSSFIHIYAASAEKHNFSKQNAYGIESILCKLVAIKRKKEIVFIPLIHTLNQENS
ncbi:AAEL010985-PA [Aedes aegypti]|uniref:AAEL010985-PA n=1 Tax=Aedes aegypti TaxID=7159 RepID=Q16RE2_AEDAE|nr:AAEL010985-PA [Aedes aegypti]